MIDEVFYPVDAQQCLLTYLLIEVTVKRSAEPENIFYLGIFQKIPDCFGSFRNSSVCFGCFDKGSKHRNKPKNFFFGFTKQTETNAKQILFRFVSVHTEKFFFSFRGHPNWEYRYMGCGDLSNIGAS